MVVVRDEADDLLAWIAWHAGLKVDTIFVFDDGSTDGTFEIAQLAASTLDVRVSRLEQDERLFTDRQAEAYLAVLRQHGRSFDWIGMLDADEYLDLPDGIDIKTFLTRGADVGAVAINWCNYGSSDHVLKPNDHPFCAYTHHFAMDDDVCRHVKSFVRPLACTGRWINPHYFELDGHRYVDPAGNDVAWSATPGIVRGRAAWNGARIMHYQCRSMEHFIERMRKRPDLPKSTGIWHSYDRNTVQSEVPVSRRLEASRIIGAVVADATSAALRAMKPAVPPVPARASFGRKWFGGRRDGDSGPDLRPGSGSAIPAAGVRLWSMLSDHGFVLRLRIGTGEILADRSPDERNTPPAERCFLLTIDGQPGTAFLLLPGAAGPVQMKGEIRVPRALRFLVSRHGDRVALRNPASHRYLSAPHAVHGGVVTCDRFDPKDWETFRLAPVSERDAASTLAALGFDDLGTALAAPSFLADRHDPAGVATLVPVLLALIDPAAATRLRAGLGAVARYVV